MVDSETKWIFVILLGWRQVDYIIGTITYSLGDIRFYVSHAKCCVDGAFVYTTPKTLVTWRDVMGWDGMGCRTDKQEDRVEVGYQQLAEASSIAEVSWTDFNGLGADRIFSAACFIKLPVDEVFIVYVIYGVPSTLSERGQRPPSQLCKARLSGWLFRSEPCV